MSSFFAVAVIVLGYWLHRRAPAIADRFSAGSRSRGAIVLVKAIAIFYIVGGCIVVTLIMVGLGTGRL